MAHEIETKVLDIDRDAIASRLEELGAKKTQDTRLVVDWYRPKGTSEADAPWYLRIRSYTDGTHEVTWKARSEIIGVARKHKEINFTVSDPAQMRDLFEELGLEAYAHQEKDRLSFSFKDWKFDIDAYPGMPPYMEIEGTSEEHIHEALALLELTGNNTSAEGERVLIQETFGLDWYQMRF
jgi:adenylate cyclase, class 2